MLIGLIKTIFFISLFYYIFRFIGRYVLPFFLRGYLNKLNNKFGQQAPSPDGRKEGEVRIEKNGNQTDSEFVHFEEVED